MMNTTKKNDKTKKKDEYDKKNDEYDKKKDNDNLPPWIIVHFSAEAAAHSTPKVPIWTYTPNSMHYLAKQ